MVLIEHTTTAQRLHSSPTFQGEMEPLPFGGGGIWTLPEGPRRAGEDAKVTSNQSIFVAVEITGHRVGSQQVVLILRSPQLRRNDALTRLEGCSTTRISPQCCGPRSTAACGQVLGSHFVGNVRGHKANEASYA